MVFLISIFNSQEIKVFLGHKVLKFSSAYVWFVRFYWSLYKKTMRELTASTCSFAPLHLAFPRTNISTSPCTLATPNVHTWNHSTHESKDTHKHIQLSFHQWHLSPAKHNLLSIIDSVSYDGGVRWGSSYYRPAACAQHTGDTHPPHTMPHHLTTYSSRCHLHAKLNTIVYGDHEWALLKMHVCSMATW